MSKTLGDTFLSILIITTAAAVLWPSPFLLAWLEILYIAFGVVIFAHWFFDFVQYLRQKSKETRNHDEF